MFFQRKEEPPKVRLLTSSPLEDALAAGSIHSEEHRLFLFLSSRADRQRVRTSWEELALLLRRTRKQVLKSANKLRLAGLMRYPDQRGKAAGSVVTLRLAPLFEQKQPNVPPPPPPLPEAPRPVEPPRPKPRRPSFADYVQCTWEELFERRGHTLANMHLADHKRRKVEAAFAQLEPRDLSDDGAFQIFEHADLPLSLLAWSLEWTEDGRIRPRLEASHMWRPLRKQPVKPPVVVEETTPEPEVPVNPEVAADFFKQAQELLDGKASQQSAPQRQKTPDLRGSREGGAGVGAGEQRPAPTFNPFDQFRELLFGAAQGHLGGLRNAA